MAMFEAILAVFQKAHDPYQTGYSDGRHDAIRSLEPQLPMMVDAAMHRLGEYMETHKASIFSNGYYDTSHAVQFEIVIRKKAPAPNAGDGNKGGGGNGQKDYTSTN